MESKIETVTTIRILGLDAGQTESVRESADHFLSAWRESVGEWNRLAWNLEAEDQKKLQRIRKQLLRLVEKAHEAHTIHEVESYRKTNRERIKNGMDWDQTAKAEIEKMDAVREVVK